jgi:AraC-like DNA-binding protein
MGYEPHLLLSNLLTKLSESPSKSLKSISGDMGVSSRTIQNVLKLSSNSFKHMQREVLLNVVRDQILQHPTITIKELSFGLGYKSPRTFARSVRSASGMSPLALRSNLANRCCDEGGHPI